MYESFLYRREKVAGEKVYWTCRDQARMGCRSRAITQGRQVTVMRSHCHPPDLLGLETLRQREKRPGPSLWDGPGTWLGWGWGAYFCCMLYTLGLLVLKLLDNSPTYLCLPAHERGAADTGV